MRNDINNHPLASNDGRTDECESWEITLSLSKSVSFKNGCSMLELVWRNSTKAGLALRGSSSWN